jgi:hypothetical protein
VPPASWRRSIPPGISLVSDRGMGMNACTLSRTRPAFVQVKELVLVLLHVFVFAQFVPRKRAHPWPAQIPHSGRSAPALAQRTGGNPLLRSPVQEGQERVTRDEGAMGIADGLPQLVWQPVADPLMRSLLCGPMRAHANPMRPRSSGFSAGTPGPWRVTGPRDNIIFYIEI